MRRRSALALLLLLIPLAAGAGELRGQLRLELPGLRLADVGPIVVYLEGGPAAASVEGAPPAEVRQHEARFSPPFLVVARGRSVAMPNDDAIYHNVFSFSAPNDFDLGLYPAGESRSVTFRHPGVVRIFCSIHESMTGTLFVAPTPWFAIADAEGGFAIAGVPEGLFQLRTFAERLPPAGREVRVGPGVTRVDVRLGEAGAP